MEKKEIIEKAIAKLTNKEKFIYFQWYMERGFNTYEDMIEYEMECLAFELNLTVEKVYNGCLEIIEDLK